MSSEYKFNGNKITKMSPEQAIAVVSSPNQKKLFNLKNALNGIEIAKENNESFFAIENNNMVEITSTKNLLKSTNEDGYFFSVFAVLILVIYGVLAKELTGLTVMQNSIVTVTSLFICAYCVAQAIRSFKFNTYILTQSQNFNLYKDNSNQKTVKCRIGKDWTLN